ncbi:MAG: reprolysin-like metallopeptidase, partial [Luteimonas sp.]
MRLSAPDGSLLRLRYLRHIEHADGNWTWIGRLPGADNEDAILTFGEHAVYGSIPQGGGLPSLRVTMSRGRTLITATDLQLAAKFGNGIKRPTKPDYFLPPAAVVQVARDAAVQADGVQIAQDAQNEKAVTTVDIAAGYTPGFRDSPGIGGDSQARTRLQFLIDVGNLAMTNSQVSVQLRLVSAMLVNYPDATDNGDALEKLTGFRAPSTQTTPAAEFSALRASRDQYGADLVTLVRRFRTPENSGCGIAWIIGGGQSNIGNGSDFFGYSVVSDGSDIDEGDGKNYFCRDETLVHELGHNMGAQHDVATARGDDGVLDADEYGRFPYSFGYKTTAATGNFYTVMAYGDSGQIVHRIFSNPRVSTCGPSPGALPCGVTDQADNARGLGQTAPLIAAFRATVVAPPGGFPTVRNDIDADGRSDLLWSRQSPGQFVAWRMNGATLAGTRSYATSTTFKAIGSGDLDGNGYVDIVWIDTATGDVYTWLGQ